MSTRHVCIDVPRATRVNQYTSIFCRFFARKCFCHAHHTGFRHRVGRAGPAFRLLSFGFDGGTEFFHEGGDFIHAGGGEEAVAEAGRVAVEFAEHARYVYEAAGGFYEGEESLGCVQGAEVVDFEGAVDNVGVWSRESG
jgi:hypothetical protein